MARIRTNKNICLYCFGDLDSDRVCMNCHHKADDAPSPPHHLPQRTVIGTQNRYLVGKALGEGGFGITYLAWDLQQGIKVALKEYFPSGYVTRVAGNNQVIINSKQNQAASNRGLKRFVEEARALAKIKNLAGVVNVRDFFSANGTAYIVMEFLDGVSLKKYLQRRGGKIAVDEVLTIMRPVMESLTQVHKIGLIHRDISPDNILITKYNEVKLIDFGAAKYSNPDGRSMSIVLKQGFAPPEQYETHGEQGPWTDVYALGVTVYYAITGTLPPESIRIMMGKETIKRPSELGIAIDAGVENALMKCLAVDRKKRYQDVQSMINGLYNPRAPRRAVASVTTPAAATPKKSVIPRTAAGATTQTAEQPEAAAKPTKPAQTTPSSAERRAPARQIITATRKPLTSKTDEQKPATAAAKPAVTPKPAARSTNTERPVTPITPIRQSAATDKSRASTASNATAKPATAATTPKAPTKPIATAKRVEKKVEPAADNKPAASTATVKTEPQKTDTAKAEVDANVKATEEKPKTRSGLFSRLFKK